MIKKEKKTKEEIEAARRKKVESKEETTEIIELPNQEIVGEEEHVEISTQIKGINPYSLEILAQLSIQQDETYKLLFLQNNNHKIKFLPQYVSDQNAQHAWEIEIKQFMYVYDDESKQILYQQPFQSIENKLITYWEDLPSTNLTLYSKWICYLDDIMINISKQLQSIITEPKNLYNIYNTYQFCYSQPYVYYLCLKNQIEFNVFPKIEQFSINNSRQENLNFWQKDCDKYFCNIYWIPHTQNYINDIINRQLADIFDIYRRQQNNKSFVAKLPNIIYHYPYIEYNYSKIKILYEISLIRFIITEQLHFFSKNTDKDYYLKSQFLSIIPKQYHKKIEEQTQIFISYQEDQKNNKCSHKQLLKNLFTKGYRNEEKKQFYLQLQQFFTNKDIIIKCDWSQKQIEKLNDENYMIKCTQCGIYILCLHQVALLQLKFVKEQDLQPLDKWKLLEFFVNDFTMKNGKGHYYCKNCGVKVFNKDFLETFSDNMNIFSDTELEIIIQEVSHFMRLFKFPVDVDIKKTKKIIPSIIYGLVYDDSQQYIRKDDYYKRFRLNAQVALQAFFNILMEKRSDIKKEKEFRGETINKQQLKTYQELLAKKVTYISKSSQKSKRQIMGSIENFIENIQNTNKKIIDLYSEVLIEIFEKITKGTEKNKEDFENKIIESQHKWLLQQYSLRLYPIQFPKFIIDNKYKPIHVKLTYIYGENGLHHKWNQFKIDNVLINRRDVKDPKLITDYYSQVTTTYQSQIDKLSEQKVLNQLEYQNNVENIVKYYVYDCPKGQLHDFDSKSNICKKCQYQEEFYSTLGEIFSHEQNQLEKELLKWYEQNKTIYLKQFQQDKQKREEQIFLHAKITKEQQKNETVSITEKIEQINKEIDSLCLQISTQFGLKKVDEQTFLERIQIFAQNRQLGPKYDLNQIQCLFNTIVIKMISIAKSDDWLLQTGQKIMQQNMLLKYDLIMAIQFIKLLILRFVLKQTNIVGENLLKDIILPKLESYLANTSKEFEGRRFYLTDFYDEINNEDIENMKQEQNEKDYFTADVDINPITGKIQDDEDQDNY